jgi:hypothetical protein
MELRVASDVLQFFCKLSGRLEIQLSEPAQKITPRLENLAAPASAKLLDLTVEFTVFERDARTFRDLTPEEWERVVIVAPSIRMRGGRSNVVVEHRPENGASFTVRELAAAVAETERQARGQSEWFGGIDVHHVYFEGISLDDDGVWDIRWGS